MTEFDTLSYEADGPIATIAFDNGKVNAMTPLMHRDLYLALVAFLSDDRIKVGILTSARLLPGAGHSLPAAPHRYSHRLRRCHVRLSRDQLCYGRGHAPRRGVICGSALDGVCAHQEAL